MNSISKEKRLHPHKILLLFFLLVYVGNVFYHLLKVENFFYADLRNRVVGARLMARDTSPYYFKWQPATSETLIDPFDRPAIKNNMITSPPSVLWLMQPLANLTYSQITFAWIVIQQICFLIILLSLFYFFKSNRARTGIAISGVLLLLSDQWWASIYKGQSHFFLPAILGVCILLSVWKSSYHFFAIGFLLALMVWIRPVALLIVPFIFCCRHMNRKFLLGGFAGGSIFLIILTFALHQENYWIDFANSCKDWLDYFESGKKAGRFFSAETLEGKKLVAKGSLLIRWKSEVSNLFPLLANSTGIRISQTVITTSWAVLYLTALLVWFKTTVKGLADAIMAGLFFYWLFEITGTIPKMSYYYVELFVIVYFLAGKFSVLSKSNKLVFLISLICLFLDFIPLNLTLSEILLIVSLCQYLLQKYLKNEKAPFNKGAALFKN